ncbi:MAG: DUF4199 family protein [Bacteroidetes bacterium]|nr:DUF4199 family protein [Bacteroidota bacterium]MBS1980811.1 DUF4199 family protein [Bacteroidota bacterium]
MNLNLLRYSFTLGLILILIFLISVSWPSFENNILLLNVINFGVIGLALFLYFRHSTNPVSYCGIIKQSLSLAILSGLIVVVFFVVYVNFINSLYFQDIAISEVEKLRKMSYDEATIRKTLRVIGVGKRYHIKEISLFISIVLRALILTLIFGPIFTKKIT